MNKLVERRITVLKQNPLDEKFKIKSLVDGDFAINRGDTIEYHFHNKKKPIICKVNKLTGCHIVTSNVPRNDGYVMFSVLENDKMQHYYAHRKIYTTYNGEIEEKKTVMHECDNPSCINPNHLLLGTHADNMRDKERKGRGNQLKGECKTSNKLTVQDVIFIKNNLEKYTDQEFAAIYGIVYQNFYYIRNGTNWSHINKEDDPHDEKFQSIKRQFTLVDVELIQSYKYNLVELSKIYNCAVNTLSRIRRGELPQYLSKLNNE